MSQNNGPPWSSNLEPPPPPPQSLCLRPFKGLRRHGHRITVTSLPTCILIPIYSSYNVWLRTQNFSSSAIASWLLVSQSLHKKTLRRGYITALLLLLDRMINVQDRIHIYTQAFLSPEQMPSFSIFFHFTALCSSHSLHACVYI